MCDSLNDLLKSYEHLEDVIPPCLLPVFKPYVKRAERVLQPGVTTHGWTALVIDECTYPLHYFPTLKTTSPAKIAEC